MNFYEMTAPKEKAQYASRFIETRMDGHNLWNYKRNYERGPPSCQSVPAWHKENFLLHNDFLRCSALSIPLFISNCFCLYVKLLQLTSMMVDIFHIYIFFWWFGIVFIGLFLNSLYDAYLHFLEGVFIRVHSKQHLFNGRDSWKTLKTTEYNGTGWIKLCYQFPLEIFFNYKKVL